MLSFPYTKKSIVNSWTHIHTFRLVKAFCVQIKTFCQALGPWCERKPGFSIIIQRHAPTTLNSILCKVRFITYTIVPLKSGLDEKSLQWGDWLAKELPGSISCSSLSFPLQRKPSVKEMVRALKLNRSGCEFWLPSLPEWNGVTSSTLRGVC